MVESPFVSPNTDPLISIVIGNEAVPPSDAILKKALYSPSDKLALLAVILIVALCPSLKVPWLGLAVNHSGEDSNVIFKLFSKLSVPKITWVPTEPFFWIPTEAS